MLENIRTTAIIIKHLYDIRNMSWRHINVLEKLGACVIVSACIEK